MNTWKVIFATVVIFVAGVVTGGLLMSYSGRTANLTLRPSVATPPASVQATNTVRQHRLPPPWPGPLRKNFLDRLQKELKTDPAQCERIEKIIREGQEETQNIWLEIEPEMHRILVETKENIRAQLTAEQQTKFENLFKSKSHTQPKPAEKSTNAPSASVTNSPAAKP